MGDRTTETEVTFIKSFILTGMASPIPPGTYRVVVDEEEIGGLSFIAYRRTATMLHLPALAVSALPRHVILVDPKELAAAIIADADPQSDHETSTGVQS